MNGYIIRVRDKQTGVCVAECKVQSKAVGVITYNTWYAYFKPQYYEVSVSKMAKPKGDAQHVVYESVSRIYIPSVQHSANRWIREGGYGT